MGFLNGSVQGISAVDPDRAALEGNFDATFGKPLIPQIGTPNVLQQLMAEDRPVISPDQLGPIDIPTSTQDISTSRPRRSVLDMIGGAADVIATVGGATPQYQPRLDAARDRDRLALDDSWKEKFNTQKFERGGQELETGEIELSNAQNARLGQAVRGLSAVFQNSGPEGVMRAWPLVAETLGIPEEQRGIFAEVLRRDPEGTITALNSALTDPRAQGSRAKELDVYDMFVKQGRPDLAEKYMERVATGENPITAYQLAQLAQRDRDFNYQRGKDARDFDLRERQFDAKQGGGNREQQVAAASNFLDQIESVVRRLKDSGGMSSEDNTQLGEVAAFARQNLPLVERLTSREGFAAREELDGLLTQGVSSLLPVISGMTIGSRNMDAAKEMENLKRAVLSASSYEAAINAIQRYRNNLAQTPSSGGSRGNRRAPAPRRGSGGNRQKPSVSNW